MKIQLSDHFTTKRLLRFIFPSVIMMVFTSIYGVVDGLFITNCVGKTPFAALNIIWPFIGLMGGIGFMLGSGGSALVGKTLGEKDNKRANEYFSMVVLVTAAAGILLSVAGILAIRPVARLLGAAPEMMEDAVTYGRICLCFNSAFMLQNQFQGFFVTAEKPRLGLAATVAAGVTNIALDALFVAGLNMGVAGAALATGISQFVGGVLPVLYFALPNNSLLHLRLVKPELRPLLRCAANGSSELMTNLSMSFVTMLYNIQLMRFNGENAVAANGVLMYTNWIYTAIFIGYNIGIAPVISYHYGAQNHAELKNLLKKYTALVLTTGLIIVGLGITLAGSLAGLFVGYDDVLTEMTKHAYRIAILAFFFIGFNSMTSNFFTSLNNGLVSAEVSFTRTLLYQILAVMLLPLALGIEGVWWANTTAEFASFITCAVFLFCNRKKYRYM